MSLFVVATPIGNLNDISKRAFEVLQSVDLILAEDTRHSKKLLDHLGIKTPMMALHEHNEEKLLSSILTKLQTKDLALISDAGTPLISDPGFKLINYLKTKAVDIVTIPGACALVAALSVSGLATDSFTFIGFLPAKPNKRKLALQRLEFESKTMIFYESPKRVIATLKMLGEQFSVDRLCCVAKELTKINEQVVTLPIKQILIEFANGNINPKGEFVVLLAGSKNLPNYDEIEVKRILKILSESMPAKQAIKLTSEITSFNKNMVYKLALNQPKPA